jgi:hypothetical protein
MAFHNMPNFKLALDRGSVRSYDAQGFLHVAVANLSKANICPYLGEEIPGYAELGLDKDATYQLYRDPDEIKKGAPTCNGLQLMSIHIEVSADEPQKEVIAGAIGDNARFVAPYLQNSLTVWDGDDIKNIENDSIKEISCGYRYRPDMTLGEVDGVKYDGVMRDIVFNHVALVEEGRAGSDVVIGDSINFLTEQKMGKKSLSTKASMVKGAVLAHLGSKMAADQMPKLNTLLSGVRSATWSKAQKETVAKGVVSLAKDANLEELVGLLDRLDGAPAEDDDIDGMDDDPEENLATAKPVEKKPDLAPDDADGDMDEEAIIKKLQELLGMLKKPKAKDEPPKTEGAANNKPGNEGASTVKGEDGEEEKVDKKAMDAALKLARDGAVSDTIAKMNAIYAAKEAVKPYVGEIAIACDSASGVYAAALKILGVDTKGVHADAYPHILAAQQKAGEVKKPSASIAQDAAPDDLREAFPSLYRLGK